MCMQFIQYARDNQVDKLKTILLHLKAPEKKSEMVNFLSPETNTPALFMPAQEGHVEVVRLLLENGARKTINAQWNQYGNTALLQAALKGHDSIVELLLAFGADPNVRNHKGYGPLTAALQQGHCRIAHRLIGHGANVGARETELLTYFLMSEDARNSKNSNFIVSCLPKNSIFLDILNSKDLLIAHLENAFARNCAFLGTFAYFINKRSDKDWKARLNDFKSLLIKLRDKPTQDILENHMLKIEFSQFRRGARTRYADSLDFVRDCLRYRSLSDEDIEDSVKNFFKIIEKGRECKSNKVRETSILLSPEIMIAYRQKAPPVYVESEQIEGQPGLPPPYSYQI